MKIIWVISIIILSVSFSSYGEVYKWIDKQGNVHYTDRPVNNSKEMNVDIDSKKKEIKIDDRAEQRRKLADAMEEDRIEKEKLKNKKNKQKKKLKRKCQWAKDQLRSYESAGSLYNLDKEGKRIILSDSEREKTTHSLRADIKKHCK
ncbi:MAG: DUF4124 domain-containing protein [Gammaproteobacteria bacterium]|nr:DUF4124 domain-containing protein [Gammaproteobacteria bacterium]MCW8910301.1 DUF4124 domain-containing protein [Gammaproteobacteria bacterium]MCW9005507.1 DUF4124 domain-containing protein [Gammaproteobacteria bacterium]MCW9057023.1 DUF4124 domain-containing protein [Gammaproteobacteria bacterium]